MFLIEIAIPVCLTFGMVGIYMQIKPQTTPASTPGNGFPLEFSEFYKTFSEPICTYYDSTVFWRCSKCKTSGTAACDKLIFAVAPAVSTDSALVSAAQDFATFAASASGGKLTVTSFTDNSTLNNYITQPGYSFDSSIPNIGAAIVFTSGAPSWKYDLRVNHTVNQGFNYQLPKTGKDTNNLLKSSWESGGSRHWDSYLRMWYLSGTLSLQNLVDSFIIASTTGNTATNFTLASNIFDFPFPAYEQVGFWGSVSDFYGVLMVISILLTVSNVIRHLVMEKELKIREGMRMMSLSDLALFSSWSLHFLFTYLIISILITLVGSQSLFKNSSPGLIWLYYFLFLASTMTFCFFMSTFFSRSKVRSWRPHQLPKTSCKQNNTLCK